MTEQPMIFIKRFYTEYKIQADGSTKEVDWVEYGPIGSAQYLMSPHRIKDLQPANLDGKNSSNPVIQMAHARWNLIRPKYEAWKSGQTVAVNGTPLAAWNGVSAAQAENLRMNGVHTVEDVAKLTDAHKNRIRIPGLTNIVENAKRFLLSVDKTAVTKALEEKDAQIADLKAKQDEMMATLAAIKAQQEAPKRGPGRPPKVREAAA